MAIESISEILGKVVLIYFVSTVVSAANSFKKWWLVWLSLAVLFYLCEGLVYFWYGEPYVWTDWSSEAGRAIESLAVGVVGLAIASLWMEALFKPKGDWAYEICTRFLIAILVGLTTYKVCFVLSVERDFEVFWLTGRAAYYNSVILLLVGSFLTVRYWSKRERELELAQAKT